tara:strand:+ start:206 stop:541 length:336 start_codon:yes stop_codon:yes gene_type:complete
VPFTDDDDDDDEDDDDGVDGESGDAPDPGDVVEAAVTVWPRFRGSSGLPRGMTPFSSSLCFFLFPALPTALSPGEKDSLSSSSPVGGGERDRFCGKDFFEIGGRPTGICEQ